MNVPDLNDHTCDMCKKKLFDQKFFKDMNGKFVISFLYFVICHKMKKNLPSKYQHICSSIEFSYQNPGSPSLFLTAIIWPKQY